MTVMSPPRALLWDVGNVIVRWDPRTLYAKMFQEPADLDRFLSHVCTMQWHGAHDRGVSFEDNAAALIAQHPQHEAQILAWSGRWTEMLSGVIGQTEEVMHALADAGVAQYGLTNMPPRWWPGIQAMSPVFGYLRDTVVSGDEGVIKPDPAIFQIVLRRTGLAAHEFLFVDDSAANIAAAHELGFHTHHFTDPAALRPALARHGLL